jgi:hypothetical protein
LANEGDFQWIVFSFNLVECRQPNNNILVVLLGGIESPYLTVSPYSIDSRLDILGNSISAA